jgi:hypothetical protein
MKKILALVLTLCMVAALVCVGGTALAAGQTIYVLGPTPDHGWTAQAGAYAQAKCDEITAEGNYKAVYMPASSGEEQVDQCNTIIANGDAALVVMMALDDSAQAGQEALYFEEIPFISFDRIIEATEAYAALNASGDNWQCGAGIAYWLQKNGMEPGDTVVVLYGDNGTVCSRRQEGFEQFLRGEVKYSDAQTGEYETTTVWTQDQLDAMIEKGLWGVLSEDTINDLKLRKRILVPSYYTLGDEMETALAAGEAFKADTLEELAQKMGIDVRTFVQTVETYNHYCDSRDEQFGKRPDYLKPIRKAPFYACKFFPGAYGTLGGIKINHKTEVINEEFRPIPGLYAAGTDTCTIYGDSYMFKLPGNSMGYSVNTGRMAAESAASYIRE